MPSVQPSLGAEPDGNRPGNTRGGSAVSPSEQRLGRAFHLAKRANHRNHRRWARHGPTPGDERRPPARTKVTDLEFWRTALTRSGSNPRFGIHRHRFTWPASGDCCRPHALPTPGFRPRRTEQTFLIHRYLSLSNQPLTVKPNPCRATLEVPDGSPSRRLSPGQLLSGSQMPPSASMLTVLHGEVLYFQHRKPYFGPRAIRETHLAQKPLKMRLPISSHLRNSLKKRSLKPHE